MKKILFTLLIAGIAIQAHAQDFREITWGMSIDEVKAIEGSKYEAMEGGIVYETNVGGQDAYLLYFVLDGRVVRAGYMFSDTYTNSNTYVVKYNEVRQLLEEIYGEPHENIENWTNNLYKGQREHYGTAVSMGHVGFGSEWETESTEITHALTGNNFEITHIIVYQSLEHLTLIEEAEKKKKKSGL